MHVGPSWQVGLHINPCKVISYLRVHSRDILPATAHSPAGNAQLVPFLFVLFLANQRSPTVTLEEKSCLGLERTVTNYSYSLLHVVQGKKHLRWLLVSRHFKFWVDSNYMAMFPDLWLSERVISSLVKSNDDKWQLGHKRNIHHHLHWLCALILTDKEVIC